eukprot:6198226-Pleurochrysis_carterae.AAC.2
MRRCDETTIATAARNGTDGIRAAASTPGRKSSHSIRYLGSRYRIVMSISTTCTLTTHETGAPSVCVPRHTIPWGRCRSMLGARASCATR